jgi:hypothetical protein
MTVHAIRDYGLEVEMVPVTAVWWSRQ